jgi:hypothetical protein
VTTNEELEVARNLLTKMEAMNERLKAAKLPQRKTWLQEKAVMRALSECEGYQSDY